MTRTKSDRYSLESLKPATHDVLAVTQSSSLLTNYVNMKKRVLSFTFSLLSLS